MSERDKKITVIGAAPVHPHRGEPSRIELRIVLAYLHREPVATAVLTHREAIVLARQLIQAAETVE